MSGAVVCERPGSPRDSLLIARPSTLREAAYTWDDNGDLTARGSDSFSRDYEDRMVEATVNSVTTTFAYRGDGLRNSRAVSGGATTTFIWDPSGEGLGGLPVVLDDGNQYVYGAGLSAMKQSGSWYYYLADGLGSTMAIVDSSGNSQKSYTYDVYGEATPSGGLANEFDFAGQQTDGTGMQYLRARYYDPETGAFVSRDPLSISVAWSEPAFGYAGQSPTTFSDATGLCKKGFGLVCKAGSGAKDVGESIVDKGKGKAGDLVGSAANEAKKHLWGGDPLTNLKDLQSVLMFQTGWVCGSGAVYACVVVFGATALVTFFVADMYNEQFEQGSISWGHARCLKVTNVLVPFPLSLGSNKFCALISEY